MSDILEYQVLLSARSPILIGSGMAAGNVQTSRLYVPGSVWRGAVARQILNGLGAVRYAGRTIPDEKLPSDFHEVFLGTDASRFGTLYPVGITPKHAGDITTLRIPVSSRKRKYGAKSAYDGMVTRAEEHKQGVAPYSRARKIEPSNRWDKLRGSMRRFQPYIPSKYGIPEMRTRSFVRVGLNRKTETAADGALYVLDALVPSTKQPITFIGSWYGTAAQAEAFAALLNLHLMPGDEGGYLVDVGTARARGMGDCELILRSAPSFPTLQERIHAFNARLGTDTFYATLTLRSPLLLIDDYGQSATTVTDDLLRTYLPQLPVGVRVLSNYSVVESETWTGWAATWGLPKPIMTTLSAGSVLLLTAPISESSRLVDVLASIENNGLGERRGEGWGEIMVCDPFHVAFWEHRDRPQ